MTHEDLEEMHAKLTAVLLKHLREVAAGERRVNVRMLALTARFLKWNGIEAPNADARRDLAALAALAVPFR